MSTRRGSADLLEPLADELESLGLPHEWVRCLVRQDDTLVYEDTTAELAAQGAGAWYEDNQYSSNGLHYPAHFFDAQGRLQSLDELSANDAATLLEEVFHAWFDQCAGSWGWGVSRSKEEALSMYANHLLTWWFQLRHEAPETIERHWPQVVRDARGMAHPDGGSVGDEDVEDMKDDGLDLEEPPPGAADAGDAETPGGDQEPAGGEPEGAEPSGAGRRRGCLGFLFPRL